MEIDVPIEQSAVVDTEPEIDVPIEHSLTQQSTTVNMEPNVPNEHSKKSTLSELDDISIGQSDTEPNVPIENSKKSILTELTVPADDVSMEEKPLDKMIPADTTEPEVPVEQSVESTDGYVDPRTAKFHCPICDYATDEIVRLKRHVEETRHLPSTVPLSLVPDVLKFLPPGNGLNLSFGVFDDFLTSW